MARIPVRIDSTPFERSHLRSPRGRGSWAFTFDNPDYRDTYTEVYFTPGSTIYAEARKMATAEAWRRGAVVAYVQP